MVLILMFCIFHSEKSKWFLISTQETLHILIFSAEISEGLLSTLESYLRKPENIYSPEKGKDAKGNE